MYQQIFQLLYKQDVDYKANENSFGFENSAKAGIKINLFNAGWKETRGKGVWGELKIATDGDTNKYADGNPTGAMGALIGDVPMKVKVDTAKIHFYKGDVDVALNILPPEAKLGSASLSSALAEPTYQTSDISKAYKNGFGVEIRNYLVDLDLIYNTNGVVKKDELKHSFAANSTIKGFINTKLYAGVAYTDKDLSYRLGADYNQSITDKLYVKPAVDFTLETRGEFKVSKMVAGALFGWGKTNQATDFELGSYNKDDYKFNEGISVSYETTLSKHDFAAGEYGKILLGLFENSLVPGLDTAVRYEAKVNDFVKGDLTLNTKYSKDFDVVGVTLEAEAFVDDAKFDATALEYSVCFWNNKVVKNTNLWAKYVGATSVDGSANTGKVEVAAKVHF